MWELLISFLLITYRISYGLSANRIQNIESKQSLPFVLESFGYSSMCVANSLASCERFEKTNVDLNPELKTILQRIKCEKIEDISNQSSNDVSTNSQLSVKRNSTLRRNINSKLSNSEVVLQELNLKSANCSSTFEGIILNGIQIIYDGLSSLIEKLNNNYSLEDVILSTKELKNISKEIFSTVEQTNKCFAESNSERVSPVESNAAKYIFGDAGNSLPDDRDKDFGPVNILIPQEIYKAEVGSTIRLVCRITQAGVSITWDKELGTLPYGRASDNRQGTLEITQVLPKDAGTYICRASQGFRVFEKKMQLEVSVCLLTTTIYGGTNYTATSSFRPTGLVLYPGFRKVIKKGDSTMFQCLLTGGVPTTTVKWARADGKPLMLNTLILSGNALSFNHVTGEEEGSYICTAENEFDKTKATAILEIQAPPVITLRPSSSPYRVQVGEIIQLECSARGDPAPTVKWKRQHMNYNQEIPARSITKSKASVEIASATWNDQGTYQCSATNSVGTSIEKIQVLVQDRSPDTLIERPPAETRRPRPSYTSPSIPSSSGHFRVPLGGSFQLRCYAEESRKDIAKELIFAFKRSDGLPLPAGHSEENGVLIIENVRKDAEGEYACTAKEEKTSREIFTIYSTLEVVDIPRMLVVPSQQVVKPGDNFSLKCSLSSDDVPVIIKWSKETGSMPSSVTINEGELLFKRISTSDEGKYICEAWNSDFRSSVIVDLIVNGEQDSSNEINYDDYKKELYDYANY